MGKTITKPKTLSSQLLTIKIGDYTIIKYVDYSARHIRRIVSDLNKVGYSFEANESQKDSGMIVKRLK